MHPRNSLHSHKTVSSLQTMYSLKTTNHSLVPLTAQSKDSLQTTPKLDQTAQEEHRAATKAKSSITHEPKSPQVSWVQEFNNYIPTF